MLESIIYPVLQTFAQTLRKGLVTSTSQQSWKTLNPYSTLSLGLLTEIVVFFDNDAIKKIYQHFMDLLVKNSYNITKVPSEWLKLKTQVVLIIKNQGKCNIKYWEVWQKVLLVNGC